MSPAPVIIAIDGRSGSGKTTLAIELAARLREHHKVSLFHLEDIYPGWNGLAAGIERYVTTVLSPLAARGARGVGQLGLGAALRRRGPHHAPGRNRPGGGRRRRRGGRTPPAGRRDLGGFLRRRPPGPGAGPGRRDLRTLLGSMGGPGSGVAGRRRRPGARRRARAQPCGRRGPGRRPAGPSVPSRRRPRPAARTRRPGRPAVAGRTDRRQTRRRTVVRDALRQLNQRRVARLLAGPGGPCPGSRGTQPLQHPGRRRRPLRPGRPAQFRTDPRQYGPGHRDHRRPVLPLARRRLGAPGAPRPRGVPLRVHAGLARVPRLRAQARNRRQGRRRHHPGRLPDLRRPRRGPRPCRGHGLAAGPGHARRRGLARDGPRGRGRGRCRRPAPRPLPRLDLPGTSPLRRTPWRCTALRHASPPGTRKPPTRQRFPRPSTRSRKATPTRSA